MDSNATPQRSLHTRTRAGGYSLVEQVSVVTIAGILMTVGVPSFRYVTNSNRVSAEVNGLLGDMQFARSEAVTTGQPVTVCPSRDGRTCSTGSQDWESGWIVFTDPDEDGTVGSSNAVLRVQRSFAASHDLFLAPAGVGAVTYNGVGFVTRMPGAVNGALTFTLHTEPVNAQWTRCLSLNVVGMITTERLGQGGCK